MLELICKPLPECRINISDLLHGCRVAALSWRLTGAAGLDRELRQKIYTAAIFHDIGKCMIEPDILNKPAALTPQERKAIRKHVILGVKLGKSLGLEKSVLELMLGHHESFDGSGYPEGLTGESILLGARVLKLCDVYDALTSDRSYRPAECSQNALQIMEQEKGTFDPDLFKYFKGVISSENKQTAYSYCAY